MALSVSIYEFDYSSCIVRPSFTQVHVPEGYVNAVNIHIYSILDLIPLDDV